MTPAVPAGASYAGGSGSLADASEDCFPDPWGEQSSHESDTADTVGWRVFFFPESIAKGSSGKSFEHLHFDTYTYTHTHWKSESIQVRSMPVSKYASVSMQA